MFTFKKLITYIITKQYLPCIFILDLDEYNYSVHKVLSKDLTF